MIRILVISNGKRYEKDIREALREDGFELLEFKFPEKINQQKFIELSETNRRAVAEALNRKNYDFVFGIGYVHEISVFCDMLDVIYVSWVLEFPNPDLYRNSVFHANTCLFLADQGWVDALKSYQVPNVFYLPPAIQEGDGNEKECVNDISFIHATETLPEINLFETSQTKLSQGTKGYLDGLIHSQRVIYGLDILKEALPQRCYLEMKDIIEPEFPKDTYIDAKDLYIDQLLRPQLILQERLLLVKQYEKILRLFSKNPVLDIACENLSPYPQTASERIAIEKTSRVNLCVNNRYYKSGMYWRTLECLGNKAFVICNFQKDYLNYFEDGENLVYFRNAEEMVDKIVRYENDNTERMQIAQRGYETVMEEHLYKHRIREWREILSI